MRLKCLQLNMFLLVFLTSCSQIEMIDSPWNRSIVPFVYSVISPGKPVIVFLRRSGLMEDSGDSIPYPDAVVSFREADSAWMELTRDEKDSCFFTAKGMTVTNGHKYQIKVAPGNGIRSLTAETAVPSEAAQLDRISFAVDGTSASNTSFGEAMEGAFEASWDAPSGNDYGYLLYNSFNILDFVQGKNECTSNIQGLLYPKDSLNFTIYLATTDIHLKKWIQNKKIQDSQLFDSGQFFLDVVMGAFGGVSPNFSNIENGIGLFGSYLLEEKTVIISDNETH